MSRKSLQRSARQPITSLGSVLTMLIISITAIALPALAASSAATTIGQLAVTEHVDLSDPQLDIPEGFPLPASAHELRPSTSMNSISVIGVTPPQAASFYDQVLSNYDWDNHKLWTFPAYTWFVACKGKVCVSIKCHEQYDRFELQLYFGKRKDMRGIFEKSSK